MKTCEPRSLYEHEQTVGTRGNYNVLPRASRAVGLSAQSSNRRETRPIAGASGNALAMYSIDLLSSVFCETSRNCRLFDCSDYRVYRLAWSLDVPWISRHRLDGKRKPSVDD